MTTKNNWQVKFDELFPNSIYEFPSFVKRPIGNDGKNPVDYVGRAINTEEIKQFITNLLQEIADEVEGLKLRPSFRSLRFDDCPNCGQKVNREWVDNETVELQKEGLDQALSIIKKHGGEE